MPNRGRSKSQMATVSENRRCWNDEYEWPAEGDEWSAQFGGTEALWWFALYPRIHRFLPAQTILEIAPGYGRWTQFLKARCQAMIAVDISHKCVEHCKARFASEAHIKFHVNDGTSLAAVPDGSIDFVFSFDSLVHVEKDVIQSYLAQLGRKLTSDGVGFIHHSNIGTYAGRLRFMEYYNRLPYVFRRKVLTEEKISALLSINLQAGRANSMTGALFREYCQQAGLKCLSQETINWNSGRCLIDGISVFARPNSRWDREPAHLENRQFVKSASLTTRLAELYCLRRNAPRSSKD
jgi:ubiquinone/menaquinone biosynthesis C-methylase UbiE